MWTRCLSLHDEDLSIPKVLYDPGLSRNGLNSRGDCGHSVPGVTERFCEYFVNLLVPKYEVILAPSALRQLPASYLLTLLNLLVPTSISNIGNREYYFATTAYRLARPPIG